jgi:hypothetical protein
MSWLPSAEIIGVQLSFPALLQAAPCFVSNPALQNHLGNGYGNEMKSSGVSLLSAFISFLQQPADHASDIILLFHVHEQVQRCTMNFSCQIHLV